MDPATAKEGAGILASLKDFPLWLLVGCAAGPTIALVGFKDDLPEHVSPWLLLGAILFSVLTAARAVSLIPALVGNLRATAARRRTFHITASEAPSNFWHLATQPDKSLVTQISVHLMVKNLTAAPLELVQVRLVRPRIDGEVINEMLAVPLEGPGGMVGTARVSGASIPANSLREASIHLMIRGSAALKPNHPMSAKLQIVDSVGNAQTITIRLRGM